MIPPFSLFIFVEVENEHALNEKVELENIRSVRGKIVWPELEENMENIENIINHIAYI